MLEVITLEKGERVGRGGGGGGVRGRRRKKGGHKTAEVQCLFVCLVGCLLACLLNAPATC